MVSMRRHYIKTELKGYSGWQCSIVRVLLGAFCIFQCHLFVSNPAGDIFLNSHHNLSFIEWLAGRFFWVNVVITATWFEWVSMLIVGGASLALMVGIFRRIVAVIIVLVLAVMLPFGSDYIKIVPLLWLLWAMIVLPETEPLSVRGKKIKSWKFPEYLFSGSWIIMGATLIVSGSIDATGALFSGHDGDIVTLISYLFVPFIMISMGSWCFFSTGRVRSWLGLFLLQGVLFGMGGQVNYLAMNLLMLIFMVHPAWFYKSKNAGQNPIVFFDGMCHLCNRCVQACIQIDGFQRLRYAPIQGKKAKTLLPITLVEKNNTIVLYSNNMVYTHSDAVIQILATCGGFWFLISCVRILPRALRDRVYRLISRYRYAWFGKRETCYIPQKHELSLFYE
jgi:predicted DCC family thiol-disulfide oxidoreductase YuxK